MTPRVKTYAEALRTGLGGQVALAANRSPAPMATTSQLPASAVSRVFGTTELLENILIHVADETTPLSALHIDPVKPSESLLRLQGFEEKSIDPLRSLRFSYNLRYDNNPSPPPLDIQGPSKELFRLQRINKRFYDVIRGSTKLQQLMFLAPLDTFTATNTIEQAAPTLWLLKSMGVLFTGVFDIDTPEGRACQIDLYPVYLQSFQERCPGFHNPRLDCFIESYDCAEASWRRVKVLRSREGGAVHLEVPVDICQWYGEPTTQYDMKWKFGQDHTKQTLGEVFDKYVSMVDALHWHNEPKSWEHPTHDDDPAFAMHTNVYVPGRRSNEAVARLLAAEQFNETVARLLAPDRSHKSRSF